MTNPHKGPQPATIARINAMRALVVEGLSYAEIGRRQDPPISKQRVHQILHRRPNGSAYESPAMMRYQHRRRDARRRERGSAMSPDRIILTTMTTLDAIALLSELATIDTPKVVELRNALGLALAEERTEPTFQTIDDLPDHDAPAGAGEAVEASRG